MEINFIAREIGNSIYESLESIYKNIDKKTTEIEIEARLGVFIDSQTQERIYLPILTPCILDPDIAKWYHFETSLTPETHKKYNEQLNRMVLETQKNTYKGDKVKYSHTKTIDHVFKNTKPKIRKTIQEGDKNGVLNSKDTLRCIDIYIPKSEVDLRIAISIEKILYDNEPLKELTKREKDRRTYKKSNISIDLTQTSQSSSSKGNEIRNEIELEWSSPYIKDFLTTPNKETNKNFLSDLNTFLQTAFDLSFKKNVFI
eukprot:GHVP01047889.1.p1 GENE.GHVP01047889.1~~GHVP01047889.1.p1  ORF type:complete len:258 (+),score=53.20 GHVP01047889.1:144-917(+)